MATITTTDNCTWTTLPSVPTSADDVVVAKNHTLTLDTITAVAKSVTLNVGTTGADVGAIFTCSTSSDSKLVLGMGFTASGATGASGAYSSFVNLDMSSAPDYSCEIRGNSERLAAGYTFSCNGDYVIKGAARKRWTRLNGAITGGDTSAIVDDATGWRIGDRIVLMSTGSASRPAKTDIIILTSVNTSTGEIGWTGGTTYAHADNCPVGNFTSNMTFRPAIDQDVFMLALNAPGTKMTRSGYCDHVAFVESLSTIGYQAGAVSITGASSKIVSISNNAFYNITRKAIGGGGALVVFQRDYNIFFTNILDSANNKAYALDAVTTPIGPSRYFAFFDSSGTTAIITPSSSDDHQIGHVIGGGKGQYSSAVSISNSFPSVIIQDCDLWSTIIGIFTLGVISNCRFGSACFSGCDNETSDIVAALVSSITRAIDCYFPSSIKITGLGSNAPYARFDIVNKNGDPSIQESYGAQSNTVPEVNRNTSTIKNSTSALEFTCSSSSLISRSFDVLAKSGETIKILCYARKSSTYGASTLPSIAVSGLGITPVSASLSSGTAADTWELLELSATNTSSADGNLTVTLAAQSSTSGAKAYFSGLPVSPFVTRCAHYGYLFDETIPTRTTNPAVVADEATALAYTGATFTVGTKRITFSSGTIDSYQKLYDHSQAWKCANVAEQIPFELAGISLLMSTGWTAVDPPAFTGSFGWAAGTIEYTTPGTYTTPISGSDVRFTTAGSYHLTGQISGTIELLNTSGGAVTVSVPAGTNYTNTGPNITVELPVAAVPISITGMVEGSNMAIYKISDGSEFVAPTTIGATGAYNAPITHSVDIPLKLVVRKGTSPVKYLPYEYTGTLNEYGFSVAVSQIAASVLN